MCSLLGGKVGRSKLRAIFCESVHGNLEAMAVLLYHVARLQDTCGQNSPPRHVKMHNRKKHDQWNAQRCVEDPTITDRIADIPRTGSCRDSRSG